MSRMTLVRRIVLVAVSALGLGMLSLVPSQATIVSNAISFDADDAVKTGESATAVLTHTLTGTSISDSATVRVLITSSNAASVTNLYMRVRESSTSLTATAGAATTSPQIFYGLQSPTINRSGETLVARMGGGGVSGGVGSTGVETALAWATTSAFDSATVVLKPSSGSNSPTSATVKYTVGLYNILAAGTYTVKAVIFNNPGGGGSDATYTGYAVAAESATWTVTVTAADKTASSASTATWRLGDQTHTDTTLRFGGSREGSDSRTLVTTTGLLTTDTTQDGSIYVVQRTASGTNIAAESFTASVVGEAYVTTDGIAVRPNAGNGVKTQQFAVPTVGEGVEVRLWSTLTPGTATVTITTSSGLVIGTKTITFTGTTTSIEVVSKYKEVIRAGTTTAQYDVVLLQAKDALGNRVKGLSISGVSSAVGVITSGTCSDAHVYGTSGTAEDSAANDGYYLCSLTPAAGSTSGGSATITWRTLLASGAYISTTQAFTMGGLVNTMTLATDKASYEPGEKMTITATAKDSSGNAPYDGQSGPSLSANKSLGSTISMSTVRGGKSTSNSIDVDGTVLNSDNLFAPAASGKFRITGTFSNAVGDTVVLSAESTVGDDAATAAAAAATDAALEAIDAANAATDAANLAAEAADAATVAAEEARDAADAATAAVEALATEVATLMAALKAQITTLANTVAKIAKKVKA